MVSTGYKGPKVARGLHPSGLREVLIHNVNEVATVNPTVQAARIAHTVGKKKRALIIAEAKKCKLLILNPGIQEGEEAGEKPEELEEPLVEGEEAQEKKTAKPRRGFLGRRLSRKPQKSAKKKSEKPKKAQKSEKTNEEVGEG